MMNWRKIFLFLVVVTCQLPAHPVMAARRMPALAIDFGANLQLQEGKIRIEDEQFTIRLDPEYRFISAPDAVRLLVEAWGNPPGQVMEQKPLGMIVSRHFMEQGALWGIVITASHDGHVDDRDAGKINSDSILDALRKESLPFNKQRKAMGADAVSNIEWATEPRYDAVAHKMFWAKDITFGKNPVHTLNYAVRILGRENIIHFNAVGDMDRYASIADAMQTALAFSEFDVGYRYQDFNPKNHTMASYGLTGLIAKPDLSKVGYWKNLLGKATGSAPLFIASLSGLAMVLVRRMGRRRQPEF